MTDENAPKNTWVEFAKEHLSGFAVGAVVAYFPSASLWNWVRRRLAVRSLMNCLKRPVPPPPPRGHPLLRQVDFSRDCGKTAESNEIVEWIQAMKSDIDSHYYLALWGRPGIGKTYLLTEVLSELGRNTIYIPPGEAGNLVEDTFYSRLPDEIGFNVIKWELPRLKQIRQLWDDSDSDHDSYIQSIIESALKKKLGANERVTLIVEELSSWDDGEREANRLFLHTLVRRLSGGCNVRLVFVFSSQADREHLGRSVRSNDGTRHRHRTVVGCSVEDTTDSSMISDGVISSSLRELGLEAGIEVFTPEAAERIAYWTGNTIREIDIFFDSLFGEGLEDVADLDPSCLPIDVEQVDELLPREELVKSLERLRDKMIDKGFNLDVVGDAVASGDIDTEFRIRAKTARPVMKATRKSIRLLDSPEMWHEVEPDETIGVTFTTEAVFRAARVVFCDDFVGVVDGVVVGDNGFVISECVDEEVDLEEGDF